jgi:homoserine dehydrogenase
VAEQPTLVLKFGGSVLRDDGDVARAVHEIYRHVRDGFAVVAVVSALHGETDALAARARAFAAEPDPHALAALLATGELTAAALLALAARRAGLACEAASPERVGLRVEGGALDAAPASLDAPTLRALLRQLQVVVVPGFVGLDDDGRTALLGRGGSDYTALFVAERLGARCRLVKDVRGLYERDPALPGPPPRPFLQLRHDDALALDGRIVQHKAVRFARRHGLAFEVGAAGSARATLVGAARTALLPADGAPPPRLRTAVLGAGTVGLGVVRALARWPEAFELAAVATRSPRAAVDAGVAARLLRSDPVAAVAGCDVVVEALGGVETAHAAVAAALRAGAHVVTANKALLARHGEELHALAVRHGGTLRGSAAVGGAAPVLATVARACRRGPIHRFVGVLNATSGFVLDRLAAGASLADAVHAAAAAGLAERDVALDLDGVDAAQKLVLCARAAGVAAAEADVATQAATAAAPADLAAARAGGGRVRLVAAWTAAGGVGGRPTLHVAPELLHPDHELAFLAADECGAAIHCADGATLRCRGRGAGRWPTAEAVVADLLELVRARADAAAEAAS